MLYRLRTRGAPHKGWWRGVVVGLLARQLCSREELAVALGVDARNRAGQWCVKETMSETSVDSAVTGLRARACRGRWHERRLGPTASAVLLLAGGTSLVLAACGSRFGSAATSPRGIRLCHSVADLTRLVVRRSDAFPQNHMRFSFPPEVTVTRADEVRAAAGALCALPGMPSGTINCPADFGITYHLVFYIGVRALAPVEVEASGCQVVHGLGAVRWVSGSPEFWPVLGAAMGIPSPTYATFRGSGPNG